MHFELHPQLHADCVHIAELGLSRLLLMRDANFPWCILVPRVNDVTEWIDLEAADQSRLWDEVRQVATLMRTQFRCDKLNIAALGNVVPQLHVHVVARHRDDPAWPRPVWGVLPRREPDAGELEAVVARLRAALAGAP